MSRYNTIGAYTKTPPLAFPGWRFPVGATPQYHSHLGGALREGETLSDYVYRGPGEIRPRANANGNFNVVSPHGHAGVGAVPISNMGPVLVRPRNWFGPPPDLPPTMRPCPSWGCEGPPPRFWFGPPPNTVPQPPPPSNSGSGPTVAGPCPAGQYQDAAGNCTGDWHNPYPIYLPAQPSPVVAVSPDQSSPTGTAPSGLTAPSGIVTWLEGSTIIPGVPNWTLAAAAALFVLPKFMGKR